MQKNPNNDILSSIISKCKTYKNNYIKRNSVKKKGSLYISSIKEQEIKETTKKSLIKQTNLSLSLSEISPTYISDKSKTRYKTNITLAPPPIQNTEKSLTKNGISFSMIDNKLEMKVVYPQNEVNSSFFESFRKLISKKALEIRVEVCGIELKNLKRHDSALLNPTEIIEYSNGLKTICQTKLGQKHGYGREVYEDGGYYEGQFKNDMRDGYGRLIYPKGDYYEGYWSEGNKFGVGKYLFDEGNKNRLFGDWVDDYIHGFGEQMIHNGHIYRGEFLDGEIEGNGETLLAHNAFKYKGQFKGSNYNGHGTCVDDSMKYKGEFKDGKFHGHGTLIKFDTHIKYIGHFDNGHYSKYGEQVNLRGKMNYKGNFHKNKFDGKGKLILDNFDVFDGEFKNGKIYEGKSLEKTATGKKIKSNWRVGVKYKSVNEYRVDKSGIFVKKINNKPNMIKSKCCQIF